MFLEGLFSANPYDHQAPIASGIGGEDEVVEVARVEGGGGVGGVGGVLLGGPVGGVGRPGVGSQGAGGSWPVGRVGDLGDRGSGPWRPVSEDKEDILILVFLLNFKRKETRMSQRNKAPYLFGLGLKSGSVSVAWPRSWRSCRVAGLGRTLLLLLLPSSLHTGASWGRDIST